MNRPQLKSPDNIYKINGKKREHIQQWKNETLVVPQQYQVEKANVPTNKNI